jgi:ankyrin repeat protein
MLDAPKVPVNSQAPLAESVSSKREAGQQHASAEVRSDARSRLLDNEPPSAAANLSAQPSHAGAKAPPRPPRPAPALPSREELPRPNRGAPATARTEPGTPARRSASTSGARPLGGTHEETLVEQLFDCADRGDTVTLNRLAKHGSIDVHVQRSADACTPLMVAIRNGHEAAALRLSSDASPEQMQLRDARGDTALDMALDAGMDVVARMLLNRMRSAKHPGGHTPLVATSAEGKQNRLWNLLKIGANVNEKSEDGTTALAVAIPLAVAIRKGKAELVSQLLKRGAFIEEKDATLDAPLSIAAERGHADIVALLLEHKADVNRAGREGRTALHKAASAGMHAVVAVLLKAKAKVDAVDKHGKTALQYAAENGHQECSRLLIEHGADVHHADHEGVTPLEVIDEQDWVDAEVGDLSLQRAEKGKCCAGCVIS